MINGTSLLSSTALDQISRKKQF